MILYVTYQNINDPIFIGVLKKIKAQISAMKDLSKDEIMLTYYSADFVYLCDYNGKVIKREFAFTRKQVGEIIETTNEDYDPNVVYQGTTWELEQDSRKIVVETYSNGADYYRLYNDGWIEQGGVKSNVTEATTTYVTLFKEMRDTNYNVMVTNNCQHTAKDAEGVLTASVRNVNEIRISAGYINPNTTSAFWEVKGYAKDTPEIITHYRWVRTA